MGCYLYLYIVVNIINECSYMKFGILKRQKVCVCFVFKSSGLRSAMTSQPAYSCIQRPIFQAATSNRPLSISVSTVATRERLWAQIKLPLQCRILFRIKVNHCELYTENIHNFGSSSEIFSQISKTDNQL